MALTQKIFYTSLLPSNHFRTSDAQREREIEREREREREREWEWARKESIGGRPAKLQPAQIVPPPPPLPPPRSRRLTAQKEQRVESLLGHDRSRHKESRDRREIDGFLSSSKASIFTFSSNEIDGSDHSDLKRMDHWVVACESMVVGIGGVGPWVVGCGRLCGFLLGCGGFVDSHCWCGWVVKVDLWWCWLFFLFLFIFIFFYSELLWWQVVVCWCGWVVEVSLWWCR